jgi:predicted transcriptional regulator
MSNLENNFQIVRLSSGDVRAKTDHLRSFENLIRANEKLYPEITKWYREKVLSGIRNHERVAFVGYLEQIPVISAVVKKGAGAKFCHLRINNDLQNVHLGELFFAIMALEIRDLAKTIHFTLPETLWQSKVSFFQSFGFESAKIAGTQYRLFDRELLCNATFANVWKLTVNKFPKLYRLYKSGALSPDNELLFSIRPQHAEKILRKKKTIEIRRKFSKRWLGHKINLYASSPIMSLIGEARIARIIEKDAESIWEHYHDQVACSRSEFDSYAQNADSLYAIELDEIKSYGRPVSLSQMSQLADEHLVPPQSYCTLEKNRPWAKAISIAAYLRGCVKNRIPFTTSLSWRSQRCGSFSSDVMNRRLRQVDLDL